MEEPKERYHEVAFGTGLLRPFRLAERPGADCFLNLLGVVPFPGLLCLPLPPFAFLCLPLPPFACLCFSVCQRGPSARDSSIG